MLVEMRDVITGLERDLRSKRSQIKRLQKEQSEAVASRPEASSAHSVLAYWQSTLMPGAKELGGDRLSVVVDRIRGGYTQAELCRCVDGYAAAPYVVSGRRQASGGAHQRQVEATLIFRSPAHVDRGIQYAMAQENAAEVLMPKDGDEINPVNLTGFDVLSDLGQHCVRYGQRGWHCFPCRKLGKEPAIQHGVLAATADPDRLLQWWWRHPEDNIGLACGAASNVVVVDIDGEVGALSLRELELQNETLPLTASVNTPSGGRHYYFQHPGVEIRNSVSMLGMGIDVRGDGGYVIAPPSVLEHGAYEVEDRAALAPMPQWMTDQIVAHQNRSGNGKIEKSEVWAQLLRTNIGSGTRNQQLTRVTGWLLSQGVPAPEALELVHITNEARVKPPLERREVDRIVESIVRIEGRRSA